MHADHVADETEGGVAWRSGDQAAVLAREAHGVGTVDIDRADDVTTDFADQHHAGDVEGLGVGDPQASTNAVSLPSCEKLADLRSAAVHHDGFQADGAKQDDVLARSSWPDPPWRCYRISRR